MEKTGSIMIYLSACAICGVKPNSDYIAHTDMEKLFHLSQYHSLTSIVCEALESAGIKDKNFKEAKAKSIRKNILMDAEREKIFDFMEKNAIWHMPLKGIGLKDLYPKSEMREMSDNDILYDKKYRHKVSEYMKNSGYTAEKSESLHHDSYTKKPIYNFEMHIGLFGKNHNKKFYEYYSETERLLIKDTNKKYSYHFKDEDFYVFMTAHEYKHYSNCGTGIRSLADRFIYINKKGGDMNWDYIARQLRMLGIDEFERKVRELSMKIFSLSSHHPLTGEEEKMLEFYLFSGTYGTIKNKWNERFESFSKESENKSKTKYILSRIFPPLEFYKKYYPFFYRHKILLPICWIKRFFIGLIMKRKRIKSELDFLYK